MYKLIIEDDEGKTTVVPLIRDEISIGRKEGNTIRLTERNVSRRHAKLLKQNGAVFIEDLASYNGIKVNGNRISGRVAVAEGDRIQIGDYVLGLKVEGQAGSLKDESRELIDGSAETSTAQIDVSDLAEVEARSLSTNPARLVCVSRNFAGLEFSLSQSAMVIGRVDSNDIVINHRSISRNHAKIVEEHGRYTIVDLESANGVRVNGDDYGKVELRKGDLIDLGHVRLRFVAPGEDFIFSRDATIVDGGEGAGSNALWVVLALVAVLGIGFVLWWVIGRDPGPAAVNGPTPDGATGVSKRVTPDQTAELTKIETFLAQREWSLALKSCGTLVGTAATEAKERCTLAAAESKAKALYDEAVAAAIRNEHQQALAFFLKIPKTSTYHLEREKSATYAETRNKYQAQALTELDELIKRSDCDGARKMGEAIKQLVSSAAATVDGKVGACKGAAVAIDTPPTKVVVQARQPREPRHVRQPRQPRRVRVTRRGAGGLCRSDKECKGGLSCGGDGRCVRPPPTAQELASANQQKDQAWVAYRTGNYKRTVELGKQYLRVVPNDQQIIAIVGFSACQMKSTRDAKAAYARLNTARRSMLRRLCLRQDITLP